ncbi:MAG: M16 family metallopeptidase [Candidatus Rokuibacteriota bacterium]
MRGIPRILLLLALSGLASTACSSAVRVRSAAEAPTRHVLHNGVRVLIQEYPSSEVVAVQLWVRAGGRDEAAAELGLAHYLEHMLFKGTTTRAKGFVDSDVEAVGGRIFAGS